jgi:hypothetical protein
MYCALPPSLKALQAFCKEDWADEEGQYRFLIEFLNGLSAFGVSIVTLSGLRRHLRLMASLCEDVDDGITKLEDLLKQHDLLLGPDLGGFANLLLSGAQGGEITSGGPIDFRGLEIGTQALLFPVGIAAEELMALEDVRMALDLNADRVAACIVFDQAHLWLGDTMESWIKARDHLEPTLRLFKYRTHLKALSADFLQRELLAADLQDFALWFLALFVCGELRLNPFERRLADTMVRKAGLGSLAAFAQVL